MSVIVGLFFSIILAYLVGLVVFGEEGRKHGKMKERDDSNTNSERNTFECRDCGKEYKLSMQADDRMCEYCWLELMS